MISGVKSSISCVWPERKAPVFASKRLRREFETIAAMVEIYCRGHHGQRICPECDGLLAYARLRLERCRFGAEKPTCANCPVHCYQPARREQVRAVMRFAGPRMLWEHPWLTLHHWLDGLLRKRTTAASFRRRAAEEKENPPSPLIKTLIRTDRSRIRERSNRTTRHFIC